MSEQLWGIEEAFHNRDRKQSRKHRKMASRNDRSKFKKSDQDQLKKQQSVVEKGCLGKVLTIVPEGVVVSVDGASRVCQLRGAMKKEHTRLKNLIAVGDNVIVTEENVIVSIQERTSILSRADNLSRNKEQLIAVNIDQVLITASVVLPELKPFLIDRYIISAQKGNLEPIIVVNKIDLLQDPAAAKEKELYEECVRIYRQLGITIIGISAVTGEGMDQLRAVMQGKTSVFSGQSGVGKSSLINIVTQSCFAVGAMVSRTNKGSHTTTTTQLIALPCGGFCIDTPGIRSFGVWDLSLKDVTDYFSEIAKVKSECKYLDCRHLAEPDCAVQRAVEEGVISFLRFSSYCALMQTCASGHQKR